MSPFSMGSLFWLTFMICHAHDIIHFVTAGYTPITLYSSVPSEWVTFMDPFVTTRKTLFM